MAHGPVVQPVLPVRDLAASAAYWESVGFEVRRHDDGYAWVWRDGHELWHLQADPDRQEGTPGTQFYVHTPHVDRWHTTWRSAGRDATPLAVRPWGMREFSAVDPDGHTIRVGTNA